MPHSYKLSKYLKRILIKLKKKDKKLYECVLNKLEEVINNPDIDHYKNLRYDFKKYKRVHLGSYVLVFKYDKEKDIVYFNDLDHHDNIYKKK